MPITGSQMALMQARSGVMRCGASRSGYFTPLTILLVSGIDRTDYVQYGTLRDSTVINDQPDSASFTISPNSAFVPTVAEPVIVACVKSDNREFGGHIVDVRTRRVKTNNGLVEFYDVDCIDYGRL